MEDDQLSRSYWRQSRTSPVRYKILCSFEECFFFFFPPRLRPGQPGWSFVCVAVELKWSCVSFFFLFLFCIWSLWVGCWRTTVACSAPYAHHWVASAFHRQFSSVGLLNWWPFYAEKVCTLPWSSWDWDQNLEFWAILFYFFPLVTKRTSGRNKVPLDISRSMPWRRVTFLSYSAVGSLSFPGLRSVCDFIWR